MKKKDGWEEELSARMDGEAHDALFQEHPEAKARQAEYAMLGDMLRAMPEPDEDPWFVTRVMARIEQPQPSTYRAWRTWRYWFGTTLLATAAAMAFVSIYPHTAEAPAINDAGSISSPDMDEDIDQLMASLVEEEEEGDLSEEGNAEGEGEAEVLSDEWKQLITREVYAYVADSDAVLDEGEML